MKTEERTFVAIKPDGEKEVLSVKLLRDLKTRVLKLSQ